MKEEQERIEAGKRVPVLVVRTSEWTLWVLAGLVYLGYVVMAAMEAPTLPVTVGLALLPALRLLPDRMLIGVGIGVGWFLGGLALTLSAYTLVGLLLASQLLALAAGRSERWGWIIGMVVGYVAGIWWGVSR
ncbi:MULTISPECIES: hypothetical protein [Meiothermus]|uniref:Uncharacterized protein n=2 Tax=Meiothermus TaxID=65551 RepID=D3PNC0_MEIRD|nr:MULTISPECIES: hypothetical protein [Meiothermus]ADD27311.1 hypothetical protein Mrub_0536 [Meiothermus ruber DSM 1279]AGK03765.1 hypothetical protein K649_02305 [Meiothermus ruber DSM 1279]GEM84933.1 hypothetical protein MHY01S_30990 [Meiothermus hypogaeus NBRC 106114]GIW28969.1 MAG: hypothetical protein KatS3mg070_2332 [Meiothermus sp.]